MSAAKRLQQFVVTQGAEHDVCPLCGIWRIYVGYLRETCGDGFARPGCFVTPPAPAAASANPEGER